MSEINENTAPIAAASSNRSRRLSSSSKSSSSSSSSSPSASPNSNDLGKSPIKSKNNSDDHKTTFDITESCDQFTPTISSASTSEETETVKAIAEPESTDQHKSSIMDSIGSTLNTLSQQEINSLAQKMQRQRLEAKTPIENIVCVDDLEELATVKLDRAVFDYFGAGADDELTLHWNRTALSQRYYLKPRVMCDVSKVDITKYIFGDKLSMPIGVSPTALHKMVHPKGEVATVKACDKINALMVLSLFSTSSLEEIAKQAPICTKWQNIYILKNREVTQNVIDRARRYNYRALVVTCDAPILGTRRRDVRNNFTLGQHKLENIHDSRVMTMKEHSSVIFDPSVNWQDLADLKKGVGDTIRVIAKGIMTPEDAEMAIKAGVDGIYVSNHGGRQLDGAPSTIEVLPSIVEVVKKRCPIFVDGGFRTGADVLKALALGADMVLVGRPVVWGLACYGEDGVHAALRILGEELKKAMMLCGCSKLNEINRDLVQERFQTSSPLK